MGRLSVILFFLSMTFILMADITLEFQINPSDSQVRFAGENSIINSPSNIYAVYCRQLNNTGILELAISHGYGSQFFTRTIDTLYTEAPSDIHKVLPIIKQFDNENIIIVYNKADNRNKLVLHKAMYNTTLNIFTITELKKGITSAPHMTKYPDDPTVYYSTSFQEKIYDYAYFIDNIRSVMPEEYQVYMYYTSHFYGDVHSNGNIVIAKDGFPTFEGFVSAHERIKFQGGYSVPLNDPDYIAEGGEQYAKKKYLPDTADKLREVASTPFDSTADIVYVKINGSTYQSMYANISETQVQIPVYSWYPADDTQARDIINNGNNWYEDAHIIWTNTVTKYDTVWTLGPSGIAEDNRFWLDTTLWIEGTISGLQIWGSSKDVYLTSDILYAGTPQGRHPDGYSEVNDDYSDPVNFEDYFFMISEGSIYMKYKHRDPFLNNTLRYDNCFDIDLYGCYAAIGFGDTLSGPYPWYNASKFTFEYMDPHIGLKDFQSISPYTLNDTLYSDVVYHRYIIADPTTVPDSLRMYCLNNPSDYIEPPSGPSLISAMTDNPGYHNSYPNNIASNTPPMIAFELPGYNPVGAENRYELAFTRGDVNIYGGLISRRTGYFLVTGRNDNRHNDAEWDIENHLYGTTTSPAGYNRRFFYHDARFDNLDLPEIPNLNYIGYEKFTLDGDVMKFEADITQSEFQENTGKSFYVCNDSTYIFISQRVEDNVPIASFDVYLSSSINDTPQYIQLISDIGTMELNDVEMNNNLIYLLFSDMSNSESLIYTYNISTNMLSELYRIDSSSNVCDLDFLSNNQITLAQFENAANPDISIYTESSQTSPALFWNSAFMDNTPQSSLSKIYYDVFGGDFIFMCFQTNEDSGWGNLYAGIGDFDVVGAKDDELTIDKFSISNYPNPFNPETNIAYSIPEDAEVEISIYNIKGQKVKTLLNEKVPKGNHNIIWNGVDDNNTQVGSGVYFYKLKADSKTISVNKCVLIK